MKNVFDERQHLPPLEQVPSTPDLGYGQVLVAPLVHLPPEVSHGHLKVGKGGLVPELGLRLHVVNGAAVRSAYSHVAHFAGAEFPVLRVDSADGLRYASRHLFADGDAVGDGVSRRRVQHTAGNHFDCCRAAAPLCFPLGAFIFSVCSRLKSKRRSQIKILNLQGKN